MLLSLGGPIVAGASTMAFSMIMFVLTDGWGLTSAIPLLFGGAMLFGVVAAYFIDDPSKRGDPVRIFTGVGILFVAVLLNTFATRCVLFVAVTVSMNNKDKQKEETKSLLEEDHSADAMSSAPLQSSSVPEVVAAPEVVASAPEVVASAPEVVASAPEAPAVVPEVPAEKPVETAAPATTETPAVPAAPEVPVTAPASTTEGTQPSETSVIVTEEAPRKVGLCAFSDP